MTRTQAIKNRNTWHNRKISFENKAERLMTAASNYETCLNENEWYQFRIYFQNYCSDVDPALEKTNWEGSRVKNYKDKLISLSDTIIDEEYKHWDIITQLQSQATDYETSAQNAQSNIDYWQSVIDNWDEEDN